MRDVPSPQENQLIKAERKKSMEPEERAEEGTKSLPVDAARAVMESLRPMLAPIVIVITKPTRDSRVGMQLNDEGSVTFVEHLVADGLAAASGIELGDAVMAVNDVPVTDCERGASLVLAADGAVRVKVLRTGLDGAPTQAAREAAAPPREAVAEDALGSGASLQSLGVDLSSVLPQSEPRTIDVDEIDAPMPETLVDGDGRNAHAIACRYCGCSILPRGKVVFVPECTVALPPMPGAPREPVNGDDAEPPGCWRAGDKYDFDNLGVSRAAGEGGLRYLICAECDLGPFGWFADTRQDDTIGQQVDFYVAVGRVKYK